VTDANFDRIKEGMSRAEVEEILGPAGDYTTGPTYYHSQLSLEWLHLYADELPGYQWQGDDGTIVVFFDEQVVAHTYFTSNCRLTQGRLDNLLWRFKRQWRRWFP
jgi:hypothetical protein